MADGANMLLLGPLDHEGLQRTLQAAVRDGYHVEASPPEILRAAGMGPLMRVWRSNVLLTPPDVVIHKNIKTRDPAHALLCSWERQGVVVLNSPLASQACNDKWHQQNLFAGAGIPQPYTELVRIAAHLYEFAREHGYPFVVKPIGLSAARGVNPVLSYADLRTRIDPMLDGTEGWLAQQLVTFSGSPRQARDRKAVVVDGEIVTVMQRTGAMGEIAASRYGEQESVPLGTLSPNELKYVPAAADAVGVTWCSVDYWLTDNHPEGIMINEVNGFPALPAQEAEPFAQAAVAAVSRTLQARAKSAVMT
jgi:glutathione synthase/RimK-type ligase-like ATP-grasp enzyme